MSLYHLVYSLHQKSDGLLGRTRSAMTTCRLSDTRECEVEFDIDAVDA